MKQLWKPGNMIYPLPAVLVTVGDMAEEANVFTVAWTGTVCTNPAMAYISVRKERHSYGLIKKYGEFVINLTTEQLVRATDFCGVRSGRDVDKFKEMNLKTEPGTYVKAPLLSDSPVNVECRVVEIKECGSHDMFIAEVLGVHADEAYMDEKGKFDLAKSNLIIYSHGEYYTMGKKIGTFGYSVKQEKKKK